MRIAIIIIIVLFVIGCVSQKKFASEEKFSINLDFYPSFHPPINLKIEANRDSIGLVSRVFSFDTTNKITSLDSFRQIKSELTGLLKSFKISRLLSLQSPPRELGFDGIRLKVRINVGKRVNQLVYWSPKRKDNHELYKLLDAVFDIAWKKLLSQENYFEDAQNYFDYGIGIKIKNHSPLIIKMYGSYDVDDWKALERFFKKLPRDKPIIFDMSNFMSMGTILYDLFTDFDETRNNTVWVTPGFYRQYFINVGLDSSKMVSDIETARHLIQKQTQ